MKVGDLVIRKIREVPEWKLRAALNQKNLLGHGIVLSKNMAGRPKHPCVNVYYAKAGMSYSIAESLLEVIND